MEKIYRNFKLNVEKIKKISNSKPELKLDTPAKGGGLMSGIASKAMLTKI